VTSRTTATDRVFALLRERIVGGDLVAGSQHSIYRLSEQLEVSRTPVREAVLRLADLGLVEIERNRGVRIRGVSVADVREVFELRLLLAESLFALLNLVVELLSRQSQPSPFAFQGCRLSREVLLPPVQFGHLRPQVLDDVAGLQQQLLLAGQGFGKLLLPKLCRTVFGRLCRQLGGENRRGVIRRNRTSLISRSIIAHGNPFPPAW